MPNINDARLTYRASLGFVAARTELPVILNERGLVGCGVEVGVKEGEFSEHLLRHWAGAHLISVDPWLEDGAEAYLDIANVPQAMHEVFYQRTRTRLAPFGTRSTIRRQTSTEAAERLPHHSLDFVYLDARHDYESVLEDLAAWADKVRPGGILAGHDYLDGNHPAGVFGVKSAVDEFFAARGIAVYSTLLDEPWLTWFVEIPAPAEWPDLPADYRPRESVAAAPSVPGRVPDGPSVVRLDLGAAAEGRSLQLALDPAHMTQRMMLEQFTASSLYEPETSQFVVGTLRPGDTFVDVGAHVGYFGLLAATVVGPTGRVACVEPNAENFARLRHNVDLNGFTHVSTIAAAAADRDGTMEFHVNLDNDGGHALWDVGHHAFNANSRISPCVREVQVVQLDSVLAAEGLPTPRILKIDAEGAELHVLRGARGLLTNDPIPFVICEVNRFGLEEMGSSEAELRAYMVELGYEVHIFVPGETSLYPLGPGDYAETEQVFNLLFRHPMAA
jgi:FkbM family methyltransferase